jgi:hypothetical protein
MPADPTVFGADVFYARHLVKHNFVLWCSSLERPDLGGRETDDNRFDHYTYHSRFIPVRVAEAS